jgi:biotin transporter BioY
MWLAVGATGGYLMSFITMLFSYCAIRRREFKMETNYYHPRNQF